MAIDIDVVAETVKLFPADAILQDVPRPECGGVGFADIEDVDQADVEGAGGRALGDLA